jgi:hypothetical protein
MVTLLVIGAVLLGAAIWVVAHRRTAGDDRWFKGRALALGVPTAEPRPAVPSMEPEVTLEAEEKEPLPPALVGTPVPTRPAAVPPEREGEYHDPGPKSVLQLQRYREISTVAAEDGAGRRGQAVLINLNPLINRWFLLQLELTEQLAGVAFHIENSAPDRQRLLLDGGNPRGVVIEEGGVARPCELWGPDGALLSAARSGKPYAGLCAERLYLRNPVRGRKTTLEWATDFLRDNLLWGEQITVFVRENFYADAHLETAELIAPDAAAHRRTRPGGAPPRPAVAGEYETHYLVADELGLRLESDTPGRMLVGRWYAARDTEGIYVSAIKASLLPAGVLELAGTTLNPLDEVEKNALVYMVAFDLEQFDLGFALGTDHPRVGWSERVPESTRVPGLPGPDGFGTVQPLVLTGMVSPGKASRIAATFTGGFKRSHGAFKWGRLSHTNRGSHYGFIEDGVILSRLQPELATVLVFSDGSVELKTWREEDDGELWRIRHARQNGLPIIDYDDATGLSRPGTMVPNWSQGNWSGSQDQRLRTLRAGICLQESERGRFLIYGYFSGATPSGMAVVFTAYGCRYAMLLDMNALEHTYLATYRVQASEFRIQHLIEEMSVLDKSDDGQYLPRFVGFPDNRDFFFLLRKAS